MSTQAEDVSLVAIKHDLENIAHSLERMDKDSREHRDRILALLTNLTEQKMKIEFLEKEILELKARVKQNANGIQKNHTTVTYASGAAAVIAAAVGFIASKIF